MDRYDAEDLRRYHARKRKQKEYQAEYRRKLKKERIPDREEIAATVLSIYMKGWIKDAKAAADAAKVVSGMLSVGPKRFDRERAQAAFFALLERERKRLRRRQDEIPPYEGEED